MVCSASASKLKSSQTDTGAFYSSWHQIICSSGRRDCWGFSIYGMLHFQCVRKPWITEQVSVSPGEPRISVWDNVPPGYLCCPVLQYVFLISAAAHFERRKYRHSLCSVTDGCERLLSQFQSVWACARVLEKTWQIPDSCPSRLWDVVRLVWCPFLQQCEKWEDERCLQLNLPCAAWEGGGRWQVSEIWCRSVSWVQEVTSGVCFYSQKVCSWNKHELRLAHLDR